MQLMNLTAVCFLVLLACSTLVSCALPDAPTITRVLSEHNRARVDAIPKPLVAMQNLVWNSDLANLASNYANQCQWAHNGARSQGFPQYVGENLAAFSGSSQASNLPNLYAQSSLNWESEENFYSIIDSSPQRDACQSGKVCGHYTQQVWANTAQVGCGHAVCSTGSPFGSGTWTVVVCNYMTGGNYVGQTPYVADFSTGAPPCECPSTHQCGTYNGCSPALDCGQCGSNQFCDSSNQCRSCPNPCTTRCGQVFEEQCGRTYTCSCANGQVCENNVCVTQQVCNPNDACSSVQCGAVTACGYSHECPNTCSSNQVCQFSSCVDRPPCAQPCGTNFVCNESSGQCECLPGHSLVNGACVLNSVPSTPNYRAEFQVTRGSASLSVPATVLSLSGGNGEQAIEWIPIENVVDKYNSKIRVTVNQNTGAFGIGFRKGQNRNGNNMNNDMFVVTVENIQTDPKFGMRLVYFDNTAVKQITSFSMNWNRNGPNQVEAVLSFDDASGLIRISLQVNGGMVITGQTNEVYYPDLGTAALFFDIPSTSNPDITNLQFITSSTLTVSLFECLDTSAWEELFYTAMGIPVSQRSSVVVQARASGQNANCAKGAEKGAKVLASSMTVVIQSSTVSAAGLAAQFVSAAQASSASVAGLSVSSAAIVPGTAGAVAAGVPAGTTVTAAAPAAGGGLSGGAIAGIVVGSVVGGVLLLGIATVVVAAVVVAAVVIIANRDPDSPSSDSQGSPGVRQSLYNIFGNKPKSGVDVMNSPKGHQSITARSPAMK